MLFCMIDFVSLFLLRSLPLFFYLTSNGQTISTHFVLFLRDIMSTMDYIEIPASAASVVAYSFIGLTCLTFLYGIYGSFLAILQFLRFGPKRYFRRVDRPTPPTKAMDTAYGEHHMMKLKVMSNSFSI